MAASDERAVALLRGINVGGNRKVPMAALRDACAGLGWLDVRTYIQSGNVVFRAEGEADELARSLESAIEERFGFAVPVIVRRATDWRTHARGGVFPEAEAERPKLVHLGLASIAAPRTAARALESYCTAGERARVRAGALWLDYPEGVARSKVTPAVIDRVVGAPVTMRNVNTVRAITTLLDDR